MYDDNSPDKPERNHTIIRPVPGGRRPSPNQSNTGQNGSQNSSQNGGQQNNSQLNQGQSNQGQPNQGGQQIPPGYLSGDGSGGNAGGYNENGQYSGSGQTGMNPAYNNPPNHGQPPQGQGQFQQPKRLPQDISIGMNPIIDAGSTIFSLVSQLQNTTSHPDIRALHRQSSELIREFEGKLRDNSIDPDTTFSAKYAMCAILDEIILNTPWGSHSFWSTESLLTTFHRETWGGEHVYQIIDSALQSPGQNFYLLEFLYLCLSLGFMGKLRVIDRGVIQHDEIRDKIYRALRSQREEFEKELSPHCQSNEKKFNKLGGLIPAWVIISVLCLILFGVYAGFSWKLAEDSDPVFGEIHALVPWKPIQEKVPQKVPPKQVSDAKTLRQIMKQEILAGKLEINEIPGQITVKLYNEGLFPSGTATVSQDYTNILNKLAGGLEQVKGDILVVGHTDNIPIRTTRFPSNWHLSVARAKAVVEKLKQSGQLTRDATPEGRGATEPLFDNKTKENRALNRRVEILILQ